MPRTSSHDPMQQLIHDSCQLRIITFKLKLQHAQRGAARELFGAQNMVGNWQHGGEKMMQSVRAHESVKAAQLDGRAGRREVAGSPHLLDRHHHRNHLSGTFFSLSLRRFPRWRYRRGRASPALLRPHRQLRSSLVQSLQAAFCSTVSL